MKTRRIFITGGASGLGRALAHRYAKEKWSVCIGDLNEARGSETVAELKALTQDAQFLKCDVTSETDLESASEWLISNWDGVDVVVNNAGVATVGNIDELSLETWIRVVDINLLGVVRGCKVFTPLFKKQRQGTFINIASLAGIVHAGGGACYNATKAGVIALSETVRFELAPLGIQVSVVCPYFFKTNLTDTLRSPNEKMVRLAKKSVQESPMEATTIADRVFKAAKRGDFMIFPDRESRVLSKFKRFMPSSWYFRTISNHVKKMK